MTVLHRYLVRLQSTILSRGEIDVQQLRAVERVEPSKQAGKFRAQLQFYDGSELHVIEKLVVVRRLVVVKLRYVYHYQRADGALIFRYDNIPHYPDVKTYPNHKHIVAP